MPSRPRSISCGTLDLVLGVLLLSLLGLAACRGVAAGSNVQIDWINFVQFGDIRYLATIHRIGRPPTDADRGPVFGTVKFRLDGNVHDPSYQAKDGDAAFLDAGTPIYSVQGYVPTFRLVARFAGQLTFYEADTNPHARTGADLLDIGGKVSFIYVNSQQTVATQLGSITDPRQVDALVAMVLAARVDQRYQEHGSPTYFVVFHLDDGTAVTRAYWLTSGELARGILLPAQFGLAVQAVLRT